jgi:hypothetical protein
MRHLYLLKIFVLMLALAGVVYLIRHINANSIQKGLDALGVDSNDQGLNPTFYPVTDDQHRMTLCRSRIASIEINGWTLSEEGGLKKDWVAAKGGQKKVLDYLEMEKWLSQSCQIIAMPDPARGVKPKPEVIDIRFIDKSRMHIIVDAIKPDRYKIHGSWYTSPYLTEAIQRLLKIIGE